MNIYNEEITGEVLTTIKRADDTGRVFVGVRIMLASPPELHSTRDDDDRSAVTFWYEASDVEEGKRVAAVLAEASLAVGSVS